jgi:tRNA U55 pseudouridine synthase TruB
LASGDFCLEDAVTVEEFAQAAAEDRWPDLLHRMDAALTHFPALYLKTGAARRICSGQAVPGSPLPSTHPEGNWQGLARAYGPDGTFLALVAYDPTADVWRPRKVFCAPGHFS